VALYGGVMDEKGMIHKAADMEKMRRRYFRCFMSLMPKPKNHCQSMEQYRLLLEPHGAVGWAGLQHFIGSHGRC
jgi:threonine synthase